MHRVATIACVLLLAAGCHRARGSISGPGMNAKREASLVTTASARLNCPTEQLVPTFVQSVEPNLHLYQVAGCGAAFTSLLHCTGGLCTWREMPDARAATDLGCDPQGVTRTYAGGGNFAYRGCGKSITYLHKGMTEWVGQPVVAAP